jgi:hypothetical protein
MADAAQTKTIVTKKKKVLKDGTVKFYATTETYTVKGHINPDGTVSKFSPEQIADMKRLYGMGVTMKRIAADFKTTQITVSKMVK